MPTAVPHPASAGHPSDAFALSPDAGQIWNSQLSLYEGYLAGDSARIDALLLPGTTFWDSEQPALISGLNELNAVRAARPSGPDAARVAEMLASEPVIDVWGDTAVSRHLLTVVFEGDGVAPQHVRITGVWRRFGDRWFIAHNHEDVLAG